MTTLDLVSAAFVAPIIAAAAYSWGWDSHTKRRLQHDHEHFWIGRRPLEIVAVVVTILVQVAVVAWYARGLHRPAEGLGLSAFTYLVYFMALTQVYFFMYCDPFPNLSLDAVTWRRLRREQWLRTLLLMPLCVVVPGVALAAGVGR